MANVNTPEAFNAAITAGIKKHIQDIVSEEAGKAIEKVKQRIEESADSLALKMLRQYEVEHSRGRVIITVNKNLDNKGGNRL